MSLKRSKLNSKIWNQRIVKMLQQYPEAKNVENRYMALAHLIVQSYPELKQIFSGEKKGYEMLKDICYLDRQLRLYNEGNQTELKNLLEQEKIIELNS